MFLDIARESMVSLRRNRTRSTLTFLGMAWGVACFVILFAWGDGFGRALDLGLAYFGDTVSIVWNGQTSMQAGGQKAGRPVRMELTDYESVRDEATLVRRVSPEIYSDLPIKSRRRLTNSGVRGINHSYPKMRGHFIAEGRHFTPEDVQYARRVVVLGRGLKDRLFSGAPAVGEEIRLAGIPFSVIGVLKKKVSLSNYFGPDDDQAFIPFTSMRSLTETRFLSVLVVQPLAAPMERDALRQVRGIIARNHHFHPDDERALVVQTWSMLQSLIGVIKTGTQVFLLIMGVITLSIAGIGLMNVMLVAVTERTREIGIRKALGARRRHILIQFLLEAVLIAAVGGVTGTVLAQLVSMAVGVIPFFGTLMGDTSGQADIHLVISSVSVLTSLSVLGLVALLSGLFPALRASRLDPVDALRYE